MSDATSALGERLARVARVVLLSSIAVLLALMIVGPKNSYPLSMSKAQADGIAAAPGYLALTIQNASVFYLVDTNKQVICTYKIQGGQLLLSSARKFDYDSDIPEDSVPVQGGTSGKMLKIAGGDGINRAEAKEFSEAVTKALEARKKKKP